MKRTLITGIIYSFIFIFLSHNVFSQGEPVCTWGAPLEGEPGNKIIKILGTDESGVYVHRESGPLTDRDIWLEKYDNNFKKTFVQNLRVPEGTINDAQYFRKVVLADGKLLVFAQTWHKAGQKTTFNVREVSLTGEMSDKVIELDHMPSEKRLVMGDFKVELSDDKSKLLLLSQPEFNKGGNEKARLKAFDTKTWKELWTKDVDFGIEAVRVPKNEIAIDNAGDAYLFKESKGEKGVMNRSLYSYTQSAAKWDEKKLENSDVYFPYLKMFFNSLGDLIVAGFYTHDKYGDTYMEGTYLLRFDTKNKTTSAQKTESLGKEVLQNFMSEKQAAKENVSLKEIRFIDALPRSDGSILLVAELSRNDKISRPNPGGAGVPPTYSYTYTSKEVIVLCVSKEGTRVWNSVYIKNQTEETLNQERKFDSFVYGLIDDRLVILWNHIDLNKMLAPVVMGVPTWNENDGSVHKKHLEFGNKTVYATFMEEIDGTGNRRFKEFKYGLPLRKMHENAAFEMSMCSNIFYPVKDGIILYSEMHNEGKRFKFGKIRL